MLFRALLMWTLTSMHYFFPVESNAFKISNTFKFLAGLDMSNKTTFMLKEFEVNF